jgi:hypothetical protein
MLRDHGHSRQHRLAVPDPVGAGVQAAGAATLNGAALTQFAKASARVSSINLE